MKHLKSPLGTKSSPARSCLDLYLQDSNVEDGKQVVELHAHFESLLIPKLRTLLD